MSSAALAAASQTVTASPNDTIRVATIGLRGRGKDHIKEITGQKGVELVAVCDIDQKVLEAGAKDVENRTQKAPKTYTDYRKLLEDKSIDAISIATPNHWHTLMTIQACQAGKDVYVEKPCTHNLFEVKQIVAAARKYNRMVQQGSQSRSSAALRDGVQKLREGQIGDIYLSRGLCYKWRDTIGHKPVSDPPSWVDYDLWTGPAPMVPFKENRFHYNWHWYLGLRQRRPGQPGHSRSGHRALGPGREVSDQGHRDRRQVHVRRRPGDAEHHQLRVRVQRERQKADAGVRSAPLDEQPRGRHQREAAREREGGFQHHRQHLLRVEGLHGNRGLQQVLVLHGRAKPSPDRP